MKKVRTLLLTMLTAVPLATANAQVGSINANTFQPAQGSNENYIQADGAAVLPHLTPSFGAFTHYSNDLLRIEDPLTGRDASLIEHQLTTDFTAALGLFNRFQIGVGMPVAWVVDEESSTTLPTRDLDTSIGDLRITPKIQLFGDSQRQNRGGGFAVAGDVYIPTGSERNFQGNDGWAFHPYGVGEWKFNEYIRLGANVGFLVREKQQLESLQVDNELTYKGALAVSPAPDTLELIAEVAGRTAVDNDVAVSEATSPVEINGAARFEAFDTVAVTIGGGAGLNSGYGTPDWRAFIGLNLAPEMDIVEREVIDISRDTDRDGIPDVADLCPTQWGSGPDGCPDLMGDVAQPVVMCPEDEEIVQDVEARLEELCERIFFEYNRAELQAGSEAAIEEIAELLRANPAIELIEIQGHADHTGPADYNMDLSLRRARTVEQVLLDNGVQTARVTVRGYGEGDPLVTNATAEGRSLNRRVEFDVIRGPAPRCPAPPRVDVPQRRAPGAQPEKW